MSHSALHIAHVGFYRDPRERDAEQLLNDWPSLSLVAEAVVHAGARVSVVQAAAYTQRLTRSGVDYRFLATALGESMVGNRSLAEFVRSAAVDVFHVHGLGFPRETAALAELAPSIPILLQDHADRPPRFWRRGTWRRGFAAASAVAFCAVEQARPFQRAGLIPGGMNIFEIPESTSVFTPGDRTQARRQTQLHGDPCVLWVAHLDKNKDPLTVLAGFSRAARSLPGLRLWCCFQKAPLLEEVQQRIANDPNLRGRVELLGPVPHAGVELMMRAADIFVSGSHREGSGYALIEALACGLPPVVTDIPSFRALTGDGAVGRLWECGDADSLCASLRSIALQPAEALRTATRAHFERELSPAALGRKLGEAYLQLARPDVQFDTRLRASQAGNAS